jgi:hypothetical protein
MRRQVSIAELQRAGIDFETAEALAIVRQLMTPAEGARVRELEPPFGPPSPDNVFIEPDGTVTCSGCETTTSVSEAAIFLQSLLPPGTPAVPGSLRYTLARALHDVDAPPFDSIDQFSAALTRYERGDARAVVRRLLDRASEGAGETVLDRRRTPPAITDLRRQLRAADARVYEQQLALDALAVMTANARPRVSSGFIMTAAAAALLVLVGVGDAMQQRWQTAPDALPAVAPPAVARPIVSAPSPERQAVTPTDASRSALKPANQPSDATMAVAPPTAKSPTVRTPRPERPAAARRTDRSASPGLLNRLGLGWLRNKVSIRADAL